MLRTKRHECNKHFCLLCSYRIEHMSRINILEYSKKINFIRNDIIRAVNIHRQAMRFVSIVF